MIKPKQLPTLFRLFRWLHEEFQLRGPVEIMKKSRLGGVDELEAIE